MKGYTCNFTITAGRETGKKTGILTRRGNGVGDGEEFSPAPAPTPLRGGFSSPPPPRSPTGAGNFPRSGAGPRRGRGIPAPLPSLSSALFSWKLLLSLPSKTWWRVQRTYLWMGWLLCADRDGLYLWKLTWGEYEVHGRKLWHGYRKKVDGDPPENKTLKFYSVIQL